VVDHRILVEELADHSVGQKNRRRALVREPCAALVDPAHEERRQAGAQPPQGHDQSAEEGHDRVEHEPGGQEGHGQQRPAKAVIADVPAEAWTTLSAGVGSQGPRLYDWTRLRLPYEGQGGMARWLLARRSRSDPTALAYYRVSGPEQMSLADVVRVAGTRWVIEESLERAKGSVGLDQYEVRRWCAWYRYTTLALLAHAYLEVTRAGANLVEALAQKGGY